MNGAITNAVGLSSAVVPFDKRKTLEVALILDRGMNFSAHILDYDDQGPMFGMNLLVGCKIYTIRNAWRMIMARMKSYHRYYQVVLVRLPELDWAEDRCGPMTVRGRKKDKRAPFGRDPDVAKPQTC